MIVFRKPNPSSGIPIYVQIMNQILHGIETGALLRGEQLPGLRPLAEMLVVNPNTVLRVYRELEHDGVLEIRHGLGAFVATRRATKERSSRIETATELVSDIVEKLREMRFDDHEIRRLFEAGLIQNDARAGR